MLTVCEHSVSRVFTHPKLTTFIMFIMVYYTYLTNYKSKTMVEVELYPLLHQTKLLGLTARTGASTPCL